MAIWTTGPPQASAPKRRKRRNSRSSDSRGTEYAMAPASAADVE